MIRSEGKSIIVHTPLELKDKKVRRFADKLGTFTHLEVETTLFIQAVNITIQPLSFTKKVEGLCFSYKISFYIALNIR